jgi:hypothetical protein
MRAVVAVLKGPQRRLCGFEQSLATPPVAAQLYGEAQRSLADPKPAH